MPGQCSRRKFLAGSIAGGATWSLVAPAQAAAAPSDNPLGKYELAWTNELKWDQVEDITLAPGRNWDDRFKAAQAILARRGGGVVYFPPGVYEFQDSLHLEDGIVLRGAAPEQSDARSDKFKLSTRLEFPKYRAAKSGKGTPLDSAFKGIYLNRPGTASNVGVVHVAINRGHIHFRDETGHKCGWNRVVAGCILRNAAVADPAVPRREAGQQPWQRFTNRHHAAIDVKTSRNALVAGNRLPRSGEDNFTLNGYVLADRKNKPTKLDGVVFDYDNRPGIYVNHYAVGAPGGEGPNGTPDSHPWGFREGIVIRENYVFNSGRMAIGFAGDGVLCLNNVIRFAPDAWRPTTTGLKITSGASTNDNRAVEMRGWRWHVEGNDYEVHRNWAADRSYRINDGEGLMHENHVNSAIKDSKLIGNHGNAYLSLYKTGEIDGLEIRDNEIRVERGAAIMAVADRNNGRGPCRRVTIEKNKTIGGGIILAGSPAAKNVISDNTHSGEGGTIRNQAQATMRGNKGYEVVES